MNFNWLVIIFSNGCLTCLSQLNSRFVYKLYATKSSCIQGTKTFGMIWEDGALLTLVERTVEQLIHSLSLGFGGDRKVLGRVDDFKVVRWRRVLNPWVLTTTPFFVLFSVVSLHLCLMLQGLMKRISLDLRYVFQIQITLI